MEKVILNGDLIDKEDANLSIYDKGYYFDFSVYSSLKVVQGRVFYPDYHIDRLFESAKIIDLGHNFTKNEVLEWIDDLIKTDKIVDGLLRILLIGDADSNTDAALYIFQVSGLTFYPDKLYKDGAKVITYVGERRIPTAKSKDLLVSFLAYREAKKADALDALLVDNKGNLREGTRTNLFAIKGGTVFTPPDDQVLEGITKKLVLEAIKDQFDVKKENISLADLDKYDEFFITSTSMNVMPISQIDDKKYPVAKTREIIWLFKDYCRNKELRKQLS